MKDIYVDFVIAQSGEKVGYLSTNLACPIWGFKRRGDLKSAILDLRENFPNHTYTFDGIIPIHDKHAREFYDCDKIYKNKITSRLDNLPNARTIEELKQWER